MTSVCTLSPPFEAFKLTYLDTMIDGDGADADSKPSETIMTDGCGWINLAAMRKSTLMKEILI